MQAIVTSLIVTMLTIMSGAAGAQTAPEGFELVDAGAVIEQVTIPISANECFARSVIEFTDVGPRSDLYQYRYASVATGAIAGGNKQPPFDKVTIAANGTVATREPPAGKFWIALSGNFGSTCDQAAAFAADDWKDPKVLAYVMLQPTALFS